jgi:hypothetical protein
MAMGTNYYMKKEPDLFGVLRGDKPISLHLGKSSGGWCFSLRWYPERNLNSLRDWYQFLIKGRVTITDEYDVELSLDELLDIIVRRSWSNSRTFPSKFYHSEAQFLRMNQAELGPNNLLRHKQNSYTKHGPGTWDLINSEFS